MAARENQGLQIGLIVFVTLTLLLSVTTFVFFRNYQSEQQRSKDADTKATDARTAESKAKSERDQLMQYMGYAANDKIETVTDAWTKDMKSAATYGIANLPADQQNYKKLVSELQSVVRKRTDQVAKADADLRQAQENFNAKIKDFEDNKQKLTEDKEQALASYLTERRTISDQNTALTTGKKQLADDLIKKDAEKQQITAAKDTEIASMQKELAKSQTQITNFAEDINALHGKFNVNANPDGKIVWVNQRDRLVYINLGTEDRLRKRVTFSVFDPSTTDVSAHRCE